MNESSFEPCVTENEIPEFRLTTFGAKILEIALNDINLSSPTRENIAAATKLIHPLRLDQIFKNPKDKTTDSAA